MANIIAGYNPLQEQYEESRKKSIKWGILSFLSFISLPGLGPIAFLFILISFFMLGKHVARYKPLKAAISGEKNVEKVCSSLPDSYSVLSNVELFSEGQTLYLDQVIIGPGGVFLLEVKNMNGLIEGNADNAQLTQHKTGRKGGKYSKRIRNPLKQLGGQVYHLSNFLKYYNANVWVNGLLYFSNPDAREAIRGSNYPIFTLSDGAHALRDFIIKNEQHTSLSQTEINHVVNLLTGKTT